MVDVNSLSVSMFIYVIHSELVANIYGGTTRTVTHGSEVSLDAVTLSHDPDISQSSNTFTFSWSYMAGVPDLNEDGQLHFISDTVPSLAFVYTHSRGALLIDTSSLSRGASYTFRVKVEKDTRASFYDQTLLVINDNVPDIKLLYVVF